MRISQIIGDSVTQQGLDFVDVDLETDTELYIDPYLISLSKNELSIEINSKIKNFFNSFKNAVLEKNMSKIEYLFYFMSEPKDTYLGVSKGTSRNGKGFGKKDSDKLAKWIVDSNAIQEGIVNNIEDLAIFIENVDKDKISDMVTNIIRLELLKYTKQQCDFWGLETTLMDSLPYWDATDEEWVITEYPHLIIDKHVVMLVPKNFVSQIKEYNFQKYEWHHVVTPEREAMLQRRDSLVRIIEKANGEKEYKLPKKEVFDHIGSKVESGEFVSRKDFARQYTLNNPEIFKEFLSKVSTSVDTLTNKEFEVFIDTISFKDLIRLMIQKLESINTGKEHANLYHHYVKCLIEILWYPYLVNPIIEREIHDGRKRIDIVMSNNDGSSFFNKLHSISKVYCPYVFIECKNYGKDVTNPELDQLAGRFSPRRGQFGILLCRDVKNEELLVKRCQDTYKDQRGLIIHLTDGDVIHMLNNLVDDNIEEMWELLEEKKTRVMLG